MNGKSVLSVNVYKGTFILLALLCLGMNNLFAQGTVRGKITDNTGEGLIGATIHLKSNPAVGAVADLDGNYSVKITAIGDQVLVISTMSFTTIEEPIHLVNNEVLVKNFVMTAASSELKEVKVEAKAVRAKDYYMEAMKRNSATTLDFVSSESMKKSGDANVTTAVARVSGVSTNGSFITVRGIGDRYVKTAINGSRIPTLDPFTNNIKLDLFPSSLVDNIIITKTTSPDLPGDWAGAYLSIETKDYPEKLAINVETSFGYNTQSTFKDVITSSKSTTDWLGYDSGLREHDHSTFALAYLAPTQYQQFVALGYGNYFNSIGVNQNTPWNDSYLKLGLVQMGLLAPALINDPVAFNDAKTAYADGGYSSKAFSVINAPAAASGTSLANSWNNTVRKGPLDFTQSFSIGNQVKLFGHPLGFITGFRYGTSTQYDADAKAERIYPVTGLVNSYRERELGRESNGWSALANLAYQYSPNHTISILFMPNVTGVYNIQNSYDTIEHRNTKSNFYESRRQLVYQLKSENYIPKLKLKFETNASYTDGKSDAPDFKILGYRDYGNNTILIDPGVDPAQRYFRYLKDHLFDARTMAEFPISKNAALTRKVKLGLSYQHDRQKSDQYNYGLSPGNASPSDVSSIDQILSLSNFALNNNTMVWIYNQDQQAINHNFGYSDLTAAFAMVDYSLNSKFRISGGARVEKSYIYTDVDLFDSLGLAPDDIRRSYATGLPLAKPGVLDEVNVLPSVNFVYKLKDGDAAKVPMNLRLNYSQSVARPSIRELSSISMFDYEFQASVTGNPNLKIVQVSNYDLRWESFFHNNDNLSVSLFYKDFKNHIELEYSDTYYWQNVKKSSVAGIELEGRKAIVKGLEFRANISLVKSNTEFVRTRQETVGGVTNIFYLDTINRSMFGQAPYVINGIVSYNADSIGLVLTLSYNLQGPRLVLASNVSSIPDVYELERHLLDFKVTKKLNKYFSTSLTARNILNSPIDRSYKASGGYKLYDTYKAGTSFLFSLTYKI